MILETIDPFGKVLRTIPDLFNFLKEEESIKSAKKEAQQPSSEPAPSKSEENPKDSKIYNKFLGVFWENFDVVVPEGADNYKRTLKALKKKIFDAFCNHLRSIDHLEDEFAFILGEFLLGKKDLDSLYTKLGVENRKGSLSIPEALEMLAHALDISCDKIFIDQVKKPVCRMTYDSQPPTVIIPGELSVTVNTITKVLQHHWGMDKPAVENTNEAPTVILFHSLLNF